jgi:hypothetical protein
MEWAAEATHLDVFPSSIGTVGVTRSRRTRRAVIRARGCRPRPAFEPSHTPKVRDDLSRTSAGALPSSRTHSRKAGSTSPDYFSPDNVLVVTFGDDPEDDNNAYQALTDLKQLDS